MTDDEFADLVRKVEQGEPIPPMMAGIRGDDRPRLASEQFLKNLTEDETVADALAHEWANGFTWGAAAILAIGIFAGLFYLTYRGITG